MEWKDEDDNSTDADVEFSSAQDIFDIPSIRLSLWIAYSAVFSLCFFGNAAVLFVVVIRWRIRSTTRLCMGNLAFANLCVSVFCIYQNLQSLIATSWEFGEVLCKTYGFINGLSHTASILTLVAICVERYLSVLKPRHYQGALTIQRLRLALVGVWLLSALICSPRIYYITTFQVSMQISPDVFHMQVVCAPNRRLYNSKLTDMIYFVLLYLIPLALMSVLYARIGAVIWKSSSELRKIPQTSSGEPMLPRPSVYSLVGENNGLIAARGSIAVSNFSAGAQSSLTTDCSAINRRLAFRARDERRGQVLQSRKAVIRMMIAIVASFAICHLPYHLRKISVYYTRNYDFTSFTNQLLLPVTFLIMYSNCAISPILYALMSKSFRESLRELLMSHDEDGAGKDLMRRDYEDI